MQDPCCAERSLHSDAAAAVDWIIGHEAVDVIARREEAICRIEALGHDLLRTGACDNWFNGCDAGVKRVAAGVNGPLMELLVKETGHCDAQCPLIFKHGTRCARVLPSQCSVAVPLLWQARLFLEYLNSLGLATQGSPRGTLLACPAGRERGACLSCAAGAYR